MSTGSVLSVGAAICLNDIATDLHMDSETAKGFFLGAPYWGVGLTSLISGWAAERWGYRLLLLVSSLMQALGLWIVASATEQTQAVAGSLLLGLGRGWVAPPLTALLCNIYPENRTRITNIFHAQYHLGMVAAILMILGLLYLGWDWRSIFLVLAALVLPFGFIALLFPLPGAERSGQETGKMPLSVTARQAGFGLLLVCMFMAAATELGPPSWLPYFVERAVGATQELGAATMLLLALTMGVGRMLTPALVRRVGRDTILQGSALLAGVSIVLAALPVGTLFTVCCLTVLGFAISAVYPTLTAYAGDRYPRASASMYAVLNSTANLGAVAGPFTIGLAADAVGLRPAMGLLALAPLVVLVLLRRMLALEGGGSSSGGVR